MISFQALQRFFLCSLLLIAISFSSYGQARRSYNNISYTSIYYSPYVGDFYYSFGLHTSRYTGDFGSFWGEDKTNQGSGLRYSLNVGYQVTNYVSLRFDVSRYNHTNVEDIINTKYDTVRFSPFSTANMDYSLNIIHDFFPKAEIDNGERRYTPYGIFGFGISSMNTGGAGGIAPIIPFGVGFKYYIFHNMNIAFEARSAMVLSDKLDGVKAGDSKDFYTNFGLKVTWQRSYKFDYKQYKKKFYHL